jgi:diguanylate cyclase (GGDEF)-like protein
MGVSDTTPEQEFDELVELATVLCGKPLAAMSLLNDSTNFLKSAVGMERSTSTIEQSVCQFAVLNDHVMIVEDTHADPRFDNHNCAIHCENGIRFYAGMPLTTMDGTRVGALCVMDRQPSTMSPQQLRALEVLGRQISSRLQLRERTAATLAMIKERETTSQMFDAILNNIPVEVYLKDSTGKLRFYNQKLADRFNISTTEWLGKTSYDLWDHETAEGIVREDNFVLSSREPHESFAEVHEPAGATSYWRSMKVPCTITGGEDVLACCSVDITEQMERERKMQEIQDELEEANSKLNSLALTDALTGLWNRRAFDARLETNVIASQRNKQTMALMLIDADNFKAVNDTFGHPYGDEVLRQTASIMNRSKRAEDVACRFGGEEFAILLPGTTMEGATILATRIVNAFHAFPWKNGAITVSIGIAMCSPTCSSDELVDDADSALYAAKSQGKDRYVCHGG